MAPLFKRRKPAKPHFNLMTQAEYAENLEEGLANPHEYGSKMDGYSLNEMGGLVADKLRGNPVIDLACGSPNSVKRMFRLASVSGATCYKGTDINAWSNASYGVKIREFKEEMPMETYPRWEIYDKDMLTFLEGLPRTERANFLFNGIDDAIIKPDEAGWEYMIHVYGQIHKHLAIGGVVIGCGSPDDWLGRFDSHGFRRINNARTRYNSIKIYEAS